MKKTPYLFIIFILMINHSDAQKLSFGLSAGATLASYKSAIESISFTSKTKVGFTAGLAADLPISKSFNFSPQLNFVQKGGKQKEDDYLDKLTLNYVELPLNFTLNASTSKGSFFVGTGPSLSMALSGKDKWHDDRESGGGDIKFGGGDDDDLKPFEIGINALAGFRFSNGFFIAVNYNAAVNNIAPHDPDFNSKYHNRYFGIRAGFIFKHTAVIATKQ